MLSLLLCMSAHPSYRHISPSQPCSISFISGSLNHHFFSENSYQPSTLSALAGVAIIAMGFLNLLYRVVLGTEINHSDKMQAAALQQHLIDGAAPALEQSQKHQSNSQKKNVKEICFSQLCDWLIFRFREKNNSFPFQKNYFTLYQNNNNITTTFNDFILSRTISAVFILK